VTRASSPGHAILSIPGVIRSQEQRSGLAPSSGHIAQENSWADSERRGPATHQTLGGSLDRAATTGAMRSGTQTYATARDEGTSVR
jgi:hypothetical protein